MQSILVDTGPLVALISRADRHHRRVVSFLRKNPLVFLSTWPVMTEAWHLLPAHARLNLVEWALRGGISIHDLENGDLPTLTALLKKYSDRPMDLADASLVLLAEKTGITDILTTDRADFDAYRLNDGRAFKQLPPRS